MDFDVIIAVMKKREIQGNRGSGDDKRDGIKGELQDKIMAGENKKNNVFF